MARYTSKPTPQPSRPNVSEPEKSSAIAISEAPQAIDWVYAKGIGSRPFLKDDTSNQKGVLEFYVEGIVVSNFLSSTLYAPSLRVKIADYDVDYIKAFIEKSDPEFNSTTHIWPIKDNAMVMFKDKNQERERSVKGITGDFEPFKYVWDGRLMLDLEPIDERMSIEIGRLNEGSKVYLEFTPIVWKHNGGGDGMRTGTTLELLSVGLLKEGRAREQDDATDNSKYDHNSPSKKRRMMSG
jgi:hypothetical protein